ncbi:MAG: AAA family ATPase [Candidatus Methanosuratincola sp.]
MYPILGRRARVVPVRLSLRNFLSYGESAPALEFGRFRLACLTGKNGHGKSALLDAITWALWGECRVSSNADVIRHGAAEATVDYEFEVDGVRYRVVRSVKRKGITGSARSLLLQRFDPERGQYLRLEEGVNAQHRIESELIRMDYKSFVCSSFILQGRANEFMKRTPAERKAVLAKFLNLGHYDELGRRARYELDRAKLMLEGAEGEARRVEGELSRSDGLQEELRRGREVLDEVSSRVAEREKAYGELVRRVEELRALRKEAEARRKELARQREFEESLTRELGRVAGEIERVREVLGEREEILEGFQRYESEKLREREYSEKLAQHSRLSSELEAVRRAIRDEQARIEGELGRVEGRRSGLLSLIEQKQGIIGRGEEIKEGFRLYQEAQRAEGALEEKRREHERLTEALGEQEARLREERRALETRLEEVSSKISLLSSVVDSIPRLCGEIEAAERELSALADKEREVKRLAEALGSIAGKKATLTATCNELARRIRENEEKIALIGHEFHAPRCPLCEGQLTLEAKEALLEKLKRSIAHDALVRSECERKIGELSAEESATLRTKESLEEELKGVAELNSRLGEKRAELAQAERARAELAVLLGEKQELSRRLAEGDWGMELRLQIEHTRGVLEALGYSGEEHSRLRRRVNELSRFQSEKDMLDAALRDVESARGELSALDSKRQRLSAILASGEFASSLRREMEELQVSIERVGYSEEEHEGVRRALSRLEVYAERKQALDKAALSIGHLERELERLEGSIAEVRGGIGKCEEVLRRLGAEIEGMGEVEREMREVEAGLSDLRSRRDEAVREIARIENELRVMERLAERHKELGAQIVRLRRDCVVYRELVKAFGKNGIQAYIIENAVPEIEAEANRILRRLSEGTMSLKLELAKPTQKGGEKETLEIKIGDSAGTRPYESYSGGEAFRIDFALRVAISKFIANRSGAELKTLVIDEGFGTQDKDGLMQFVEVIDTIKDDFEKILVISHVDELRDKFPVRIEVRKEYGVGSTFEVVYR